MSPKFFIIRANTGGGIRLKHNTQMEKIIDGVKPVPDQIEVYLDHGSRKWHECWTPIDFGGAFREDLVEQLNGARLVGLRWSPVSFVENESRLSLEQAPGYYYLIPYRGLSIERQNSVQPPKDWTQERWIPLSGTWNGADIFIASNHKRYHLFCTRRFIEVARANRWKEIKFFPLDLTNAEASKFNGCKGIEYRGSKWPPQWYPEGVTPASENLEP